MALDTPTRYTRLDWMFMRHVFLITLLLLIGCNENASEPLPSPPYPVGTLRFDIESQERTLPVQLWYPTTEVSADTGIENFEVGMHRDILTTLIESLDHNCARVRMQVAFGATVLPNLEPQPVILFSHCHSCARFSSFTTAHALAAQGYIVAAPDHVGDTLYDELADNPGPLNSMFLQLRAGDISKTLDAVLNGHNSLPQGLNPDPERVGIFGHSFGAVTTGLILQNDARFKAGVAIAAPIENPLIPGVLVEEQHRPILYLVATEDNSITEIGNTLIRQNYAAHPAEAWKLEVEDAGHWSFSDICGLTPDLMPGCGSAQRQTDRNESVTYIDNSQARSLAAQTVLSFFNYQFYADEDARSELIDGLDDAKVSVMHHDGMADSN